MEDWVNAAKSLGFLSEREMYLSLYTRRGWSIKRIASVLECGTATIARRMELCAIDKRTRGGANNLATQHRKMHRMDQRLLLIYPIKQLASIVDVHYTTLYTYRRRVMEGKADEVCHYFAHSRPGEVRDAERPAPGAPASEEHNVSGVLPSAETKG